MSGEVIIAVAPNGARKTKEDHENIPLTSLELAQSAKDCINAGASMIHLHVRNSDYSHSLSTELYKQAIDEINQHNIFIQVTSESVDMYSAEEQFEMIHTLKPKAVSIGLREIQGLDESTINTHFQRMKTSNTHPQIILYNEYDLNTYHHWLEKKVLPGKAYPVLFVIGKETSQGSFTNNFFIKENIKTLRVSSWMICAFGTNEFTAAKLAVNLGGHVRIGFENNSILDDGTDAIDNAALVKQMHQYLIDNGFKNANVSQTDYLMTPDW